MSRAFIVPLPTVTRVMNRPPVSVTHITKTENRTGRMLILNAPEKMHVAIKLVDAAGRLFRSWSNVTILKGETVFPLRENGRMPFSYGIVIVCIENEDGEDRMVINKEPVFTGSFYKVKSKS